MKNKFISIIMSLLFISQQVLLPLQVLAEESKANQQEEGSEATESNQDLSEEGISQGPLDMRSEPMLTVPEEYPEKFIYDSGIEIDYPEEGVKGIYVSGYAAASSHMDHLMDLVNQSDLNSMVIDVKSEEGKILFDFESDNDLIKSNTESVVNGQELMNHMEENQIYPIARISAFKDSQLPVERPDLAFSNYDGSVWTDSSGQAFTNPYLQEVWDYNVEIAIEAAKMGFKEIQFDYVRFPEGFETFAGNLSYDMGVYADKGEDPSNFRVQAITDFVAYATEKLKAYGVDVSVDIFGYAATQTEASGIGQNFLQIAEEVDVISAMIYPSHWGSGHFDLPAPDLYPYELTEGYIKLEKEILNSLDSPPTSRPWLQDFTADYLSPGMYRDYGVEEVEAQIRALEDNNVHEFLLWNAENNYTTGVDYTPSSQDDRVDEDEPKESSESSQ